MDITCICPVYQFIHTIFEMKQEAKQEVNMDMQSIPGIFHAESHTVVYTILDDVKKQL